MITRLRALPWGWITIGVAYFFAVLPIQAMDRMVWLGLAVAMAYLVLAIRTTHTTAELAQSSDDQSIFGLWQTAFRATLGHRGLLVIPMFSLMMAAQAYFTSAPTNCTLLFKAYCSFNQTYGVLQAEFVLISAGVLGLFLLLDHGLLLALTLLAHKHLPKSAAFVGNTAIGMRFTLACAVVALVAISLQLREVIYYSDSYRSFPGITEIRLTQTLSTAFEPLVSNGVLLSANIINRPTYCAQTTYNTEICDQYDSSLFVARHIVSAFLGMLMYGLLIVSVLRLTAPFSLQFSVAHAKAKRGPIEPEAEIAYL